ncbi:hypothetical protein IGJ83_003210 [Enterococcus pernyi]|uniref:Uncharacterized protein n=1 Tax=Enterococcus mundtii TaxID=53346 RepID=A0A1V2UAG0_ENTMU|nr:MULTISPECIES: hypothetical protein [Enterococcus]ONN40257.1 hypothetical protein BTN92_15460 [Enterococcus mundtii]
MRQFQERMSYDKRENEELNAYLAQQFEELNQLISTISPDNFWENLPKIIGIDAKLTLMAEIICYDYSKLPIKEILRLVETDYRTYFKELCGNDLSANNKYSMVFNIV